MPNRPIAKTSPAGAGGGVLSRRALNRALLARQVLIGRRRLSALEMIEHLVGLQAQVPNNPYIALWSRLESFRHEELSGLMNDRRVVRIALMRSTIHTVTAGDCMELRPLLQPMLERGMMGNHRKRLGGVDLKAVAAAGRELVDERPRTFAEVGALLAERWPGSDADALAQAVRSWVPLVQVPPRGIWGMGGAIAHTSAEAWLGGALASEPSLEKMLLRYLAAFGPASVQDLQTWCGLTRLREVMERLRPRLLLFRDERGAELFDLPEAPRPDPETPLPPRFLPDYDNVILSHADRTRIVPEETKRMISLPNGLRPTVLVDGFVAATWKIERERSSALLMIRPCGAMTKRDRDAVAEEGARLLAFAEGDAKAHEIRFGDPA